VALAEPFTKGKYEGKFLHKFLLDWNFPT